MPPWNRRALVLASILAACGSDPSPPPIVAEAPAPTPASTFTSGQQRCLFAPDGELASCEEISREGVDSPAPRENCGTIGGQFGPGTCPSEQRLAYCDTTDGTGMEAAEYAIRIHYYRSGLVPGVDRAGELCQTLGGTLTPLP